MSRSLSKSLRMAVWKRCAGECEMCGTELVLHGPDDLVNKMQVDHILPRKLGGKSHIDNLRALCKSCNSKRGCLAGRALMDNIKKRASQHLVGTPNQRRIVDDLKTGLLTRRDVDDLKQELSLIYAENTRFLDSLM